jgi:hypothetical protein
MTHVLLKGLMESITKKDVRDIFKEELKIELKLELNPILERIGNLETDVRRISISQEQSNDNIQKILEALNTTLEENKEFREDTRNISSNTQNIDINKTAIKTHISDTTIHLN